MEQLGLFGAGDSTSAFEATPRGVERVEAQLFMHSQAPADRPAVSVASGSDWWLSSDIGERRAGVLRSAAFWQATHDASKLTYATQESVYAGRLREMAADMEVRPEFYLRKPLGVSDFQWFVHDGVMA